MPDNYEQLADRYQASDLKPDKRFSILPTVLVMAGDSHGKTVLDLGCGSGFFTRAFATAGAKHVIGLDSSVRQIEIARKIASSPTIEYRVADVFQDSLPPANIICCPFLLNQFSSVTVLATFLTKLHATLPDHGRVLFVVDFPTARDLKSYGARKILHGEPKDATPMTTELYAASAELICELHVFYFTPDTIEDELRRAGFLHVTREQPIVSSEGQTAFDQAYWQAYLEDTQLGYYTATA